MIPNESNVFKGNSTPTDNNVNNSSFLKNTFSKVIIVSFHYHFSVPPLIIQTKRSLFEETKFQGKECFFQNIIFLSYCRIFVPPLITMSFRRILHEKCFHNKLIFWNIIFFQHSCVTSLIVSTKPFKIRFPWKNSLWRKKIARKKFSFTLTLEFFDPTDISVIQIIFWKNTFLAKHSF